MAGQEDTHAALIEEIRTQLQPVFDGSEQPVYLYLDDLHKACNERFAKLLGYASPEEWAAVEGPFPAAFVAEESQLPLVEAFQEAMGRLAGSTVKVTWRRKAGGTVDTTVMLVPLSYKGHLLSLHFISA